MSEDLNLLEEFPPHTHGQWLATVEKQLKGAPFEKVLVKKTYEGIDIRPMYFATDIEDLPHMDSLPGEAPFVRGTGAAGAVVNSWEIAQEICDPDPETFNASVRLDTGRGQNALNIPLDRASRKGLNPDQAEAEQVGEGGFSLATVADLQTALAGIDLAALPITLHPGASATPAAALLAAFMQRGKKDLAALTGCIGADPLGVLAEEGTLPMPMEIAFQEMARVTTWAKEAAPNLGTIAINVAPFRESGGNAVQEVAYALATAVTYIREMQKFGISPEDSAGRMTVFFSIGADFFMEIAKFRAARILWERMTSAFGCTGETLKLRMHGRTARWNKTVVDPYVNMLRVSTEAFSGIAGGCDSMHVSPFDEVFRTPDDFSRRIARNVQIILRDEGHFDRVVDPAGGCWYVESITDELAEKAWKTFQEIEEAGGMLKYLEQGIPQAKTAEVAEKRAKNIAIRKDRFVGTNMYPNVTEVPLDTRPVDREALKSSRVSQVAAAMEVSDMNALEENRKLLHATHSGADGGFMNTAIAFAAAGGTLGEIASAIHLSGERIRIEPLKIHRGAAPFERLRKTTEGYTEAMGVPPKIFLANMGPIPLHKPRSEFSSGFYTVGAFEMVTNDGFETVEAAAEAFFTSSAGALIICSTDPTYPDLVPPLARLIKERKPDAYIVLAGFPKEHIEAFRAAGVDEFLHMRSNALELLETMQKKLGVI